jgi:hypothetical protein
MYVDSQRHVDAQRRPLLRPRVFARDGFLRWQGKGLTGSGRVAHADREAACPSVGKTFGDVDEFLLRFERREPTRVEINPRRFSLRRVRDWLAEAERFKGCGEKISVDYGLPKRSYDYRVSDEVVDGERTLSQHLALVAFDRRSPVGYAGMTYSMTDIPEDRHASLRVELQLVYVDPRRRGEGYGLDLSVATSWAACHLLRALYSSVRKGTRISCTLYGDFESESGETFYGQVFDDLQVERDSLLDICRRCVDIEEIEYEAGW